MRLPRTRTQATFCVLKTQATMRQSSGEARDVAGIALFDIDEGHLLLVTGRPAGVACCGRPSAPTPDDLRRALARPCRRSAASQPTAQGVGQT